MSLYRKAKWIITAADENGKEIFSLPLDKASEALGKSISRVMNASRDKSFVVVDGKKIYLSRKRFESSRRKSSETFESVYERIMKTSCLNTIMMTDPEYMVEEFRERGMKLTSRHIDDGDFWIVELERWKEQSMQ